MYNNFCVRYKRMRTGGNVSSALRKGAWTSEEDMLLKKCIEKFGEGKWHLVPLRAGLTRCRKSCRLRWLNYLRPDIKRGDFGEDEVDLMLRLHKLLGNRWSLIAGRLPGRTANDVKNYWNTHLRTRSKQRMEKPRDSKVTIVKPQPRIFSKNLNRNPHIAADHNDVNSTRSSKDGVDKSVNIARGLISSPRVFDDKFFDELFVDQQKEVDNEARWSFGDFLEEEEASDVIGKADQNRLFDFSIDEVLWDLLDT